MSYDIYSNSISHIDIINEFRLLIGENISLEMNDYDCLRFLRARKGNLEQATIMAQNWYDWRHTLLEPFNTSNGLRFSPNIIMSSPCKLDTHPQKELLPVSHHGFDKQGNPIYWEKAGYIQSIYHNVKKYFRKEELIQMHIMSMEIITARCEYASKKFNIHSTASVTVSDMAGVSVSLDMDCIWYMQQLLAIDQAYYPEILHKFIIINSPWYFPALYNMFKPFIDVRTRDKVIILGSDYLPTLEKYIDRSVIPVEYGGDCPEIKWDAIYDYESGANIEQLNEYFSPKNYRKYTLSQEELSALRAAITVSGRLDELQYIDNLPQMLISSTPSSPNLHNNTLSSPSQSSPLTTTTTTTTTLPPPPPPQSPSLTISSPNSSQSTKDQKRRVKHVWKPKGMFQVPDLRVADMLSTTIIGSEDMGNHDQYIIRVNCGETISWEVKRRYSEFYAFKKRMIKVVPEAKDYDMPQKVLFKRSEGVVNHRKTALGSFLRTCIEGCAAYGTEEQDIIFRFLNAYENIIRTVELDDETMATMSALEAERRVSEFSTGGYDKSEPSESKGNNGDDDDSTWMGNESKGGESNDTYWRTPFAAAVLTAWVVLSVVGPAVVGGG